MCMIISVAINVGVIEAYFNWTIMIATVRRQNAVFAPAFGVVNFVLPTLIIMVAYIKVFLVVRRQVRSMPADVLGSFGSRTIFGSSVRSAKNLFVMCAASEREY